MTGFAFFIIGASYISGLLVASLFLSRLLKLMQDRKKLRRIFTCCYAAVPLAILMSLLYLERAEYSPILGEGVDAFIVLATWAFAPGWGIAVAVVHIRKWLTLKK